MKIKLLFAVFLLGTIVLSAQNTLNVEPAMTRKQITISARETSFEEAMKVVITNVGDRQLRLRWDKVIEYQPYNWLSQVCDREASYPPEITSNFDPIQGVLAPVVLEPGAAFDLFLTVSPYNTSGQAKISVVFRDLNQPTAVLGKATFQVNITDAEDQARIAAAGNRLTVYPNPVHDRFFLTNPPEQLARVEIYNTLGRSVRIFDNPQSGDSFAAGDLPQGVYLLRLVDRNGQVIRTLRLLRRDFRP